MIVKKKIKKPWQRFCDCHTFRFSLSRARQATKSTTGNPNLLLKIILRGILRKFSKVSIKDKLNLNSSTYKMSILLMSKHFVRFLRITSISSFKFHLLVWASCVQAHGSKSAGINRISTEVKEFQDLAIIQKTWLERTSYRYELLVIVLKVFNVHI